MIDLGPQYAGDDAFTARMRLHQSWYRAHVLNLDCGVGPRRSSTSRYGNMLRAEDGANGCNLLSPEIAAYARKRQADCPSGIEAHRLFCNMLSSQPMCFNLFAPLALDEAMGAVLLGAFLDREVARVVRVIIEHAPKPKSEYLDDATSFDTFVEYVEPGGQRAFVGIETKLTEPFSQIDYPITKPAYARWVAHEHAPWLPTAAQQLDARMHNQLWRNHMLGLALAARSAEGYARWSVAVVRHPLDHKCQLAVNTYRRCIKLADNSLIDRPLDAVVDRLRSVVRGTRWSSWLHEFDQRYVDLQDSEHLVSR